MQRYEGKEGENKKGKVRSRESAKVWRKRREKGRKVRRESAKVRSKGEKRGER